MRQVWILAASLFAASPAFAQADPDQPATPSPGGGDDANGSGAPSTAAPGAMAAGTLGGAPIIDRPLTLNAGKVGIYGDLDIDHVSVSVTVGTMTESSSNTGLLLHFGGGYGINNDLTVGAEYAFSLANPTSGDGPISLYGSYSLYNKDKLSIGMTGTLVFDIASTTDAMTMMSSTSVDVALEIGAAVRYKLTPSLALFTGSPIAPGILGNQLSIGFNNSGPIELAIPIGIAWQATPQIYAWADTELINIGISNSSTTLLFKDYIPLELGAFYTVGKNLDVGADLDFGDLKNGVDVLVFGIAARYYN
jgi:hypothetical protein